MEITHALWTKRNSVVHERATNGLLLAEAAELEEAIRAEFEKGMEDLDEDDQWLMEEGVEHVLSRPGYEQHNWLEDIRIAREEATEALALEEL